MQNEKKKKGFYEDKINLRINLSSSLYYDENMQFFGYTQIFEDITLKMSVIVLFQLELTFLFVFCSAVSYQKNTVSRRQVVVSGTGSRSWCLLQSPEDYSLSVPRSSVAEGRILLTGDLLTMTMIAYTSYKQGNKRQHSHIRNRASICNNTTSLMGWAFSCHCARCAMRKSLTLAWQWTKPGFLGNSDHSSCLEIRRHEVFRKAGTEKPCSQSKAYQLVQLSEGPAGQTQSTDIKDGVEILCINKKGIDSPWYGLKCYMLLTIPS